MGAVPRQPSAPHLGTVVDVLDGAAATGGHGTEGRAIRVLLVDDHEVILDGIESMLRHHRSRVEVVGRARSGEQALEALERCAPDIVLLDVRLRGESGLDVARQLLRRRPDCRVVFFTVYDDEQYLFQALRLGAAGFILKQASGAELAAHLSRVRDGEIVVDPTMAGRVALSAARIHSGEFWPGAHLGLTQRESEVLELLVGGLSNRAIAGRLVVGEETVKSHVGAIYRKLGVTDRTGAVSAAIREGVFH